MTLTQLQAFVETVRLGSFAAAARSLNMSQSAVSDLVRRLERELEVPLFRRGGRALSVTTAGEQLFPHAVRSVRAAREGHEAVRAVHGLVAGHATLGVLKNADLYLRTELASRFRQQYPRVRVTLTGQNSVETTRAIASGTLEAGLVILPTDEDALTVLPVAQDELVYVSTDPTRAARSHTIEDVASVQLVLYDAHFPTTDPLRRQLIERAQPAGVRIEPVVDVEHLSTALSLVMEGLGDTIVPRAAVTPELVAAGLASAPLTPPMFEVLAFVKRRGDSLTSATCELVRVAYEALADSGPEKPGSLTLLADERSVVDFLA